MEDKPHTHPNTGIDRSGPFSQKGEEDLEGDPDLARLTVLYALSVRAFNVCRAAQLERLSTIREFHDRHGGFAKLRNCGEKTAKELEDLLVKAGDMGAPSPARQEDLLTEEQIQKIYMACYSELGEDSRNALAALIGPPVAITGIDFFMRFGDGLQELPGITTPILKELRHMRRVLFKNLRRQRHALRVAQLRATKLSMEQWLHVHDLSNTSRSKLFSPKGGMNLLLFMDHYLEQFDDHNAYRLVLFHLHQPGDSFSNAKLARRFNLTKERVRQILSDTEARLQKPFEVIADLPDVQTHYPELITQGPVFLITKKLVELLNSRDGTRFAPEAILHFAHAVDPQGLMICSWMDLFGSDKLTNTLDDEAYFLIDPLIIGAVKLMTTELNVHLLQKRKVQERIDALALVRTIEPSLQARALAAFKILAPMRFPGVIAGEDHFILPPNKMKFNDDRLEEILDALNEPSHINLIMEEWQRRYPDRKITPDAIRNLVVHDKNVFACLGRTSTYALRRWEKERPGLNLGSIRELITEVLEATDLPLNADELQSAIKLKCPRTSAAAIIPNLRLDKTGMFCFFPGGYVGLAHKDYPYIPPPAAGIPGHLFQQGALAPFIGKHRNDLAIDIARQCAASPIRIERVINTAIKEGRLQVDEHGIIKGTRSNDNGSTHAAE